VVKILDKLNGAAKWLAPSIAAVIAFAAMTAVQQCTADREAIAWVKAHKRDSDELVAPVRAHLSDSRSHLYDTEEAMIVTSPAWREDVNRRLTSIEGQLRDLNGYLMTGRAPARKYLE
jgi:hypothetical protein